MKFPSINARMDKKMLDDLSKAGLIRLEKKLSPCKPNEMSMPRISNLATRCPSYQKLLEELSNMPEKKR